MYSEKFPKMGFLLAFHAKTAKTYRGKCAKLKHLYITLIVGVNTEIYITEGHA